MRKRIVAVLLVISIMTCMVNNDYHKAEAAQFAAGLSLAAVLVLAASAVCHIAGVNMEIPNWTDLTKALANELSTNDQSKDWFKEIADMSVLEGTTYTLSAALAAGNALNSIDLSKYGIPLGKAIFILPAIKNVVAKFIANRFGIGDELKVITKEVGIGDLVVGSDDYNKCQSAISFFNSWGAKSIYPYWCLVKTSGTNPYYTLVSSPTPIHAVITVETVSPYRKFLYMRGSGGDREYFEMNSTYLGTAFSQSTQGSVQTRSFAANLMGDATVIYSAQDVLGMDTSGGTMPSYFYVNSNVFLAASTQKFVTIPATAIDNTNDADLDVIPISQGLIDKVGSIPIDQLGTSTDHVLNISADTIADTQPKTTTDIWDKIKDLPNTIADAVSAALTRVFVPSDAKIQEFVDAAKSNFEDKASILTYPMQLVVMFLTGLNALQEKDFILHFPAINWMGHNLYSGSDFNLTDYSEQTQFGTIMYWLKLAGDFALIVAFCLFAWKKGQEFLTGVLGGGD